MHHSLPSRVLRQAEHAPTVDFHAMLGRGNLKRGVKVGAGERKEILITDSILPPAHATFSLMQRTELSVSFRISFVVVVADTLCWLHVRLCIPLPPSL